MANITKKIIGLFICLFFTGAVQASYISFNGYTLDEESNIVTSSTTGLEWLQWDVLVGWSISDVLTELADGTLTVGTTEYGSGWTIASTTDVPSLFYDFFGAADDGEWDEEEDTTQSYSAVTFGSYNTRLTEMWVALFGATRYISEAYGMISPMSQAIYGSDGDQDGFYETTLVYDNWTGGLYFSRWNELVRISSDQLSELARIDTVGIALVRDTNESAQSAAPIPEPPTTLLIMFGIGLIGMIRKRKLN